jgi:hypothetical protein
VSIRVESPGRNDAVPFGTANVTLTIAKIAEVAVPLVPSAVQQRVDLLMHFCDEIEKARVERRRNGTRLLKAMLHEVLESEAPEASARDMVRLD